MIALTSATDELRRQWRQQILAHCNSRHVAARKGFVAMAFVDQANTSSRFVDINKLLVVVLYEGDAHRSEHRSLRLSGYKVSRVPDGVQWGGADNCRLYKDLALAPLYGARGQRLDHSKHELLALALKLDRRLSRAACHPAAPWPGLRLPRLWAGFRTRHVETLRGEGPEFERACRERCKTTSEVFCESAREIISLKAYPLDWVSDQLDSAVAIFAEPTPSLRRQVCRIGSLPEGLIGFHGAGAYDFYNSRFRNWACGRRPSRRANHARTQNLQNESRKLRRMRSEDCVAGLSRNVGQPASELIAQVNPDCKAARDSRPLRASTA
jgi:hypothetical protein